MNIVKIYKEDEELTSIVIESINEINSSPYLSKWNCKEEIYIDEELIETKYHTI